MHIYRHSYHNGYRHSYHNGRNVAKVTQEKENENPLGQFRPSSEVLCLVGSILDRPYSA
jgi:hypothetical protein